jgi:predicted transcriptional regulator
MTRRPAPYLIRSKAQLTALTSAFRQEICDALAQSGESSVAELAAMLGRPADALYYHLRLLERVGLVRSSGRRVARGKPEALYRTPAPILEIDLEFARRNAGATLNKLVASMLRLGARDYRRAVKDPNNSVSGAEREIAVTRTTAWLLPSDLRAVNKSIADLDRAGSGKPGRGRLYAITVLVTPVRTKSSTPGGKRK